MGRYRLFVALSVFVSIVGLGALRGIQPASGSPQPAVNQRVNEQQDRVPASYSVRLQNGVTINFDPDLARVF